MAEQSANGAGHVIVIDGQSRHLALPVPVSLDLAAQGAQAVLFRGHRLELLDTQTVVASEPLGAIVLTHLLGMGRVPSALRGLELIAMSVTVLGALARVPLLGLGTALFGMVLSPLRRLRDQMLSMGQVVRSGVRLLFLGCLSHNLIITYTGSV